MSNKHLTLSDLKQRGLRLTKTEATELLPHITEISHRGLDDNYVFVGPDDIEDIDWEDEDESGNDQKEEKKVWEFYISDNDGWTVVGDYNLDENGNLKGTALDLFNEKRFPFRQIPASQVGKGDSTGNVKVMLDVDDDEDEIKDTFAAALTEEQEANLMATIGITTENSSEEYLNALNTFIAGIDGEVPPKLLKKQADLEAVVSSSQSEGKESNQEGKKEHYLTKRKRLKDAGLMEYTITQEDVDNSKFVGKVGDVIEIPIPA